jgi:hypothetical protein
MTTAPALRAPFPCALDVVLAQLAAGALRVDAGGTIWRVGVVRANDVGPVPPRRAENAGGNGYLRVTVGLPGGRTGSVMAHRIVWIVLRGPIPDGLQVNHRDLNKRNNHPDNLELVTGAENVRHALAHGVARSWSKRGRTGEWRPGKAVVSDAQVAAIRVRRAAGALLKDIAAEFGIAISHAHRLCAGVNS